MQAPTVAHEFLNLLQKSELLSPQQVRKAIEKFGLKEEMTPEVVARLLVEKKVLTPFQAERLLEGRYRGFVIDCYRVREVLGVGGMGCVYIAEDPEHDRKVALKVMSSQHALDAGMLARLKLEAVAGMQVHHPNVIQTYRIDTTGAINFLVMELVRGISLHELVALHGPVQWQMVCDMFMQVADGLTAAHEKGIVHRDIKPANILVDPSGATKLLDFGLAKLADNAGEEFSLAMIFGHDCLGTPDYISPEQAIDSGAVDARADIYSLGCTMYVALTGRVPFPFKTNSAKIEAHKTRGARSIKEFKPDVPDEVVGIVEKMMAKKTEDRFSTAAEVSAALKPHAVRRPVKFEFRQLVTLRARQARDKENAANKSSAPAGPRSSITSAAAWLNNPSHHLGAGSDTSKAQDTPATRHSDSSGGPSADKTVAPVSRPRTTVSRMNVPRGWSLKRLKSDQKMNITRVKTRIGRSSECEFRMGGGAVDKRQCVVEYDGSEWQFRQESKSKPSFIDGKASAYGTLRHGSRVTFSDGSGFELLSDEGPPPIRRFRRNLAMMLIIGAVAGLAVVAYLLFT